MVFRYHRACGARVLSPSLSPSLAPDPARAHAHTRTRAHAGARARGQARVREVPYKDRPDFSIKTGQGISEVTLKTGQTFRPGKP